MRTNKPLVSQRTGGRRRVGWGGEYTSRPNIVNETKTNVETRVGLPSSPSVTAPSNSQEKNTARCCLFREPATSRDVRRRPAMT